MPFTVKQMRGAKQVSRKDAQGLKRIILSKMGIYFATNNTFERSKVNKKMKSGDI